MKIDLSWRQIYPVYVRTRQGRQLATRATRPSLPFVYVVAICKDKSSDRQGYPPLPFYPMMEAARDTHDELLAVYDNLEEAVEHLYQIPDELAYIAGGWVIEDGESKEDSGSSNMASTL